MTPCYRLVHVINLKRLGGAELRLCEYLRRRQDARFHHTVVSSQACPAATALLKQAGIDLIVPERRCKHDVRALASLFATMRRGGYHLAHCRNDSGHVWGGLSSLVAQIQVVLGGEHGTVWSLTGYRRIIEQVLYRRFRYVVANSQATKRMITLRRRYPDSHIRIIYDGIDGARFSNLPDRGQARTQLGLPADVPVIAALGRLDTEKAFHVILEAAAEPRLRALHAHVVLAGDGPLNDWLRSYAQELAADRIHFTGFIEDPVRVYAAADLVVSTSLRESLGNTLIEAGFAGLPVIAPNLDGIPEVVKHGVTGLVLTPTRTPRNRTTPGARPLPTSVFIDGVLTQPRELDPQILAAIIADLLTDSPRRAAMGEQARRRMREMFSIERYVSELEALYCEALGLKQ